MSAGSPNCCTASKEARTVRVFVPWGTSMVHTGPYPSGPRMGR